MEYGYMGRILRVDLTGRRVLEEKLEKEVARKYIGGSGLGARFLFDETDEATHPFAQENRLLFFTGPLVGTLAPCTGRHAVIAKSPLGIWGEGDIGGSWGVTLKRAGYDGIIMAGKSQEPAYLWITDQGVEIRNAAHLWGKDTYETEEAIKKETTEKAEISCVGPAGEKLAKVAMIVCDGRHGRVGGRGGLGAVMGSKNLKAIAVFGTQKLEVAYPERIKELNRAVIPRMKEGFKTLGEHGTARGIITNYGLGDLPIKNWLMGKWDDEKITKISGQTMTETILTQKYHCQTCTIGCGREVEIGDGPYRGVRGGGPEYETIGALGTMCLIDNLQAIAQGNELCNRYGIDTISTGSAIAFAMEAYERGILTPKDTDGIALEWGNEKAMIEMVHKIGKREGIGELLGEGVKIAAKRIGKNSEEFALEVKGLEPAMHDPRALGSLAVAYATYPQGAVHRGRSFYLERIGIPELGYDKPINRHQDKGKGIITAIMEDYSGLFNSLKMCHLVISGVKPSEVLNYLQYTTGWDMDLKEFLKTGERISNLIRMYNVRLGLSRKDDTLPNRILTEKFREGGGAGYLPSLGEMLSEYYQYRTWTKEGIPFPSKLDELGLNKEASLARERVGVF